MERRNDDGHDEPSLFEPTHKRNRYETYRVLGSPQILGFPV